MVKEEREEGGREQTEVVKKHGSAREGRAGRQGRKAGQEGEGRKGGRRQTGKRSCEEAWKWEEAGKKQG